MEVRHLQIDGSLLFVPTVHRDERGYFTRTFDNQTGATVGVDGARFVQDSQSRSRRGVVRGMHLRSGDGEAKLVRCARGRIHDVLVDMRAGSPTFGVVQAVELDDQTHATLYVPRGVAHGWQALTDEADVCYRIDEEHDPAFDVTVRYDDAKLAIAWPLPVEGVSAKDLAAPGFSQVLAQLGIERPA